MYKLYQFDGVTLPAAVPDDDLSTGTVDTALVDVTNGVFDAWGTTARFPRKQTITQSGRYLGVETYLVDHAGNHIVDELGNLVLVGTASGMERAQVDALKRLIGKQATLTRKRVDDSAIQWKTARLLSVQNVQSYGQVNTSILRSTFETSMVGWRGLGASIAIAYAGTVTFTVENDGDFTIEDAIFRVTSTGTISSIRAMTNRGVDFSWSGSLQPGDVLNIDCGTLAVTKNLVDAYSGFALGSGHTVAGWMPLPVGDNIITVVGDGTASVEVFADNQMA